jgi:hypothetical protein
VTKEIPVNIFNVVEAKNAFSVSGKSKVKTRSCSPNTAYIDITFPPFFLIISMAFLVRSDETFLSASEEYVPNIINIGISQSLLNVGILRFLLLSVKKHTKPRTHLRNEVPIQESPLLHHIIFGVFVTGTYIISGICICSIEKSILLVPADQTSKIRAGTCP